MSHTDEPLCRPDCTSLNNPPVYSATWGRDSNPAASGDVIAEPVVHFTATYSLYVHVIASSNFRVSVDGLPVPSSDVTLVNDPATPARELVVRVSLDSSLVRGCRRGFSLQHQPGTHRWRTLRLRRQLITRWGQQARQWSWKRCRTPLKRRPSAYAACRCALCTPVLL